MASSLNIAVVKVYLLLSLVGAVKLTDTEFGAEFTKCIKIEDWNTKGPAEDINVTDRHSVSMCCPDGYTYGSSSASGIEYGKGMVVCGFNADGTHKGVSTGTTCDYGICFALHHDFTCSDDAKMTINGCCADNQWPDSCVKSGSSSSNSITTCTSYNKVGSSWESLGSTTDESPMADGKLVWGSSVGGTGVYNYGLCGGGGGGGGGGSEADGAQVQGSMIAMMLGVAFLTC